MIYFPHYALGSGLKNIYSAYEYNEICDFQKNGKSRVTFVTENKNIIDKLIGVVCSQYVYVYFEVYLN